MIAKGICRVCGGRDEDGCSWANQHQTICASCNPLSDAERDKRRDRALAFLTARQEELSDLLAAFRARIAVLTEPAPRKRGGQKKRTRRQSPSYGRSSI